MNKEEIKEHIDNLINNFNNMSYEEQQEELFDLYKTGEVEYVDVVDKYSNFVKKYKQLQNNWNELKKYVDTRLFTIEFDYNRNIIDRFEKVVRDNELYKLKGKIEELESRK